ncbi:Tn3 family transposase [Rhodanobacter lindaniclasticus]
MLDRYVKHAPDAREILACMVALGTNMGLWKMAEAQAESFVVTRDRAQLSAARNAVGRQRAITNAIATLPAFHLYYIQNYMYSAMGSASKLRSTLSTPDTRRNISGCRKA